MHRKGIQFLKLSWCKILWNFNALNFISLIFYGTHEDQVMHICISEQYNHWFNSNAD